MMSLDGWPLALSGHLNLIRSRRRPGFRSRRHYIKQPRPDPTSNGHSMAHKVTEVPLKFQGPPY